MSANMRRKEWKKIMNNKRKIRSLLGLCFFLVLASILVLVYVNSRQKTVEGVKEINVEIIVPDEEPKEYTLRTNSEYLGQALMEENMIKGTKSEYGLFITEVDGRMANNTKQEWWCITKNGEDVFTGVDETVITDGDHYEITLMVGYE